MLKHREDREFDIREKPLDMLRYLIVNPFSLTYQNLAVTKDGGLICSSCVAENYKSMFRATRDGDDQQWEVTAVTCESELENCFCDNCDNKIGYHEDEEDKE
jgi:hypothetical protein